MDSTAEVYLAPLQTATKVTPSYVSPGCTCTSIPGTWPVCFHFTYAVPTLQSGGWKPACSHGSRLSVLISIHVRPPAAQWQHWELASRPLHTCPSAWGASHRHPLKSGKSWLSHIYKNEYIKEFMIFLNQWGNHASTITSSKDNRKNRHIYWSRLLKWMWKWRQNQGEGCQLVFYRTVQNLQSIDKKILNHYQLPTICRVCKMTFIERTQIM